MNNKQIAEVCKDFNWDIEKLKDLKFVFRGYVKNVQKKTRKNQITLF